MATRRIGAPGRGQTTLNAGADAFLQKPADNQTLLETISIMLESNGTATLPPRWEPTALV